MQLSSNPTGQLAVNITYMASKLVSTYVLGFKTPQKVRKPKKSKF